LLKKPLNGGQPMSASVPIRNVTNVIRSLPASAPIFQMFCSWWSMMMIEPAPRKRSALKKACVKRWNIAASPDASPTAMIM
jgi:hypothetical protein